MQTVLIRSRTLGASEVLLSLFAFPHFFLVCFLSAIVVFEVSFSLLFHLCQPPSSSLSSLFSVDAGVAFMASQRTWCNPQRSLDPQEPEWIRVRVREVLGFG